MQSWIAELRKSMTYGILVAWRSRGFWLRILICFWLGAAFLILDEANNYDLRFAIRATQTPDARVIIIDIPERDLAFLQDYADRNTIRPLKEIMNLNDSYFWHPLIWQNLLTTVLEQEPAAIGVSFYFGEHIHFGQFTQAQRDVFLDPRIVWGADLDSNGRVLVPDIATTYNAHAGVKHLRPDDDGIVRRFSSSFVQIASLPAALAEVGGARLGRYRQESDLQGQQLLINYRGPSDTFVTLNVRDVLEHRIPLEILRGKVVLIGSRSNSIDQLQTPMGRMSRAEVQANITDNILSDRWIRRFPRALYLLGLAALLTFAVWVAATYPQTVALIVFLWSGTLIAALSAWTFDTFYIWLPVLSPVMLLTFTYITFLSYQLSLNEQKTWRLEQERRYLLEIEQLKNNFVSMMSHDLKTPIAKIQGIVDRLLVQAPATIAPDLKTLRRSSDDLHRYIQSILQITRVEARDFQIHKRVTDINEQIEQVIGRMQPLAAEKQITLTSMLEPMFSIEVDTTLIQEVILNLVENAIKYTPAHGVVQVISQEKDDKVSVIVEDTGVGIAPQDQEAVWRKFTRGSNLNHDSKGSGLGLYLVKYFVELHGGRVFLESLPGQGSKIGFAIPVAAEQGSIEGPFDGSFEGERA